MAYDDDILTGVDQDVDDVDQDDLDLDLDLDDADGADDDAGYDSPYEVEDAVPKQRVAQIVKSRLAREKGKVDKLYNDFKKVYGMSPEDAIKFGEQEQRRIVQQAPAPAAAPAPPVQQGQPVNPVIQKIAELDNRWRRMEQAQMMEREAAEFVQSFPGVKFEDIPKEVLDRRIMGGLTLAEAYKLYTADRMAQTAAKNAAEATARGIRNRDGLRTEGADYSGGSGDSAGSLTEEERRFAVTYGMSPKAYVAYKARVQKMRDSQGDLGGGL